MQPEVVSFTFEQYVALRPCHRCHKVLGDEFTFAGSRVDKRYAYHKRCVPPNLFHNLTPETARHSQEVRP